MNETETILPGYDTPPEWVDKLYEVVDGEYVEPTPMGLYECHISVLLLEAILANFSKSGRTGWVIPEALFKLFTKPKRQRRPDLAYVSYQRWPRDRPFPRTAEWDVIPDLAVEVVSPGNTAIEIFVKLDDYFRAGVRRVWVIYPQQGFVQDFRAVDRLEVLRREDTLEGGDILPGFEIKLADLFGDEAAPAESK